MATPKTAAPAVVIHDAVKTKLRSLVPAGYNPRQITADARQRLGGSLAAFGLVENLIANKRTGTLVGGHQRLQQLIDLLGGDMDAEIPVVWVDLDEDNERTLNVALNGEYGQFDKSKLRDLLKGLETKKPELLEFTGMSRKNLTDVLDSIQGTNNLRAKAEPISALRDIPEVFSPGEVQMHGRHMIGCLDTTQTDTVLEYVKEASAQVVFMDPPYLADYDPDSGVGSDGNWSDGRGNRGKSVKLNGIANDSGTEAEWRTIAGGMLRTAKRIVTKDGVLFFAIGQRSLRMAMDLLKDEGWYLSTVVVWDKEWIRPGRQDFRPQYEFLLYAWPNGRTHRAGRFRSESDVWRVRTEAAIEYLHPTQKPPTLFSKFLVNLTNPGEIVVDLCAGAGGMLLASEDKDRRACVFDLEPRYCDVMLARWSQMKASKE